MYKSFVYYQQKPRVQRSGSLKHNVADEGCVPSLFWLHFPVMIKPN